MKTLLPALLLLSLTTCAPPPQKKALDYESQVETLFKGSDQKFIWTQARAAVIPGQPPLAILTTSQKLRSGSDVYFDLYQTTSRDLGKTWTEPEVIPSLKIHPIGNGYRRAMSDMTPQYHRRSGKVLNTGKSFFYTNNDDPDRSRSEVAYAVYDPARQEWGSFKALQLPATDHEGMRIVGANAGCAQWVELPGGDILIPMFYFKRDPNKADLANRDAFQVDNWMKSNDFALNATVVRCRFDGQTLTYAEHGDELVLKAGRGLGEPSIAYFQGAYYLTLRTDKAGYVTRSQDGLRYEPLREWTFDDGTDLGSYNTQQHWVSHSDGLFLVYTRRGASNDHVFRHRAPLFMARVDAEKLVVRRATERVLIPEDGVGLGNFGVTQVGPHESWVVTTEYLRGETRNTDNEVFLARIRWNRPNTYAK